VSRTLPLALYAAATALAAPLAGVILSRRARAGREDPARLGERLGRSGRARPEGRLVWLHGVSVGETASLLPLVDALRARRPDLHLLVTSGTVTSADQLAQRLPDGVIHQYAPVDSPGAVARFLDHWRPDAGIFVESELWPNLILGADRRNVALGLVSARITAASAGGWARVPRSARAVLGAFDLILPQDLSSADRLSGLGAGVGPILNLKRLGEALPYDSAELERLRAAVDGRPVVLAASTHPGEELLIARATQAAAPQALLILAPRHPDRGAELAGALAATRRSAGKAPEGPIHIADTLGELGLFYRLADVVIMGGGFAHGVGGHNPLEPARIGRPILTGPGVFNAADLYAELFAQAAAILAADEAELARHIRGLLDNPVIATRMGAASRAYAARQGEALESAWRQIEPLLPA
jgi:3-deoxy-D-manno-octulosonic-acid transferase